MRPEAPERAGLASWLADHTVEVVFVLLVLAAFLYSLRITHGSYFFADEWEILHRNGSFAHLFDPYNDSLSLVTMTLDRLLVEIFGVDYTPFRVVGLLALYLVPLGYFLTTRTRFGAVLAALLAMPLLWYGPFVSLMASEHNHNVALIAAIVAAAALNRGPRADGVLAAALVLAFCAAGGGVAVAAACLVHCACTRPPWRRWVAVVVPVLAWGVWWVVEVGHPNDLGRFGLSVGQTATFVRRLAFTAFVSSGLNRVWLGYVLLAAFVVVGVLALRRGLGSGANFVAWSVAVVVWGLGLANSRGILADVHVFRYRYGALVFVLLAVVPRRPIRWPERFPIAADRRYLVAGAALVLVIGTARGLSVRSDLQASAHQLAQIGNATRASVLVVGLGPHVVPDRVAAGTGIDARSGRTAGQVRQLFAEYGGGPAHRPDTVNRELTTVALSTSRRPAPVAVGGSRCRPLSSPVTSEYRAFGGFAPVTLESGHRIEVSVRRFGRGWVPVRSIAPGTAVTVAPAAIHGLAASVPWRIRATGACRVVPAGP